MILRNYRQHYRYKKFKENYQKIIDIEKFDLSPTPTPPRRRHCAHYILMNTKLSRGIRHLSGPLAISIWVKIFSFKLIINDKKNAKEDFVGQFVLSSSYTRLISTDSSDVHEDIKYNQAHKVVLATSFSQILDCSFFLRCFLLPPGQRSIQSHSIPSVHLPQCYIHL